VSYLPIPIGGAITTLFIIERFFTGQFFKELPPEETATLSTE
jgi:hypothetical protein